jgi:hypothetical protein
LPKGKWQSSNECWLVGNRCSFLEDAEENHVRSCLDRRFLGDSYRVQMSRITAELTCSISFHRQDGPATHSGTKALFFTLLANGPLSTVCKYDERMLPALGWSPVTHIWTVRITWTCVRW